jgi:hypothetical protein
MGVFSLQSLPKTLQKTTQGTGSKQQATQADKTHAGKMQPTRDGQGLDIVSFLCYTVRVSRAMQSHKPQDKMTKCQYVLTKENQMEKLTVQELQNLFMHLIETPTPACLKTAEMVMALINDRLLQPK